MNTIGKISRNTSNTTITTKKELKLWYKSCFTLTMCSSYLWCWKQKGTKDKTHITRDNRVKIKGENAKTRQSNINVKLTGNYG